MLMPKYFIRFVHLLFVLLLVCAYNHAQSMANPTGGMSAGQKKNYPGGRDEEDLKVQAELKNPVTTVDRRSIEYRVLKTHFKKTDAEIVAPGKSDEEPPPSETE